MPSTITTYYTFSGGAKGRAAQAINFFIEERYYGSTATHLSMRRGKGVSKS